MMKVRIVLALLISFPCFGQEKRIIDFKDIKFERLSDYNALIHLGDSLMSDYARVPFYISNNGGDTYWDGLGTIREIYEKAMFSSDSNRTAIQKVNEIDRVFVERQRALYEKQYHELIEKADALYSRQSWEAARTVYLQCLTIKVADTYCLNKITEINRHINEQK